MQKTLALMLQKQQFYKNWICIFTLKKKEERATPKLFLVEKMFSLYSQLALKELCDAPRCTAAHNGAGTRS